MNELQHAFPDPVPVGAVTDPRPLYRHWIRPGDLVFDIGAHVGERTKVFLAMGCRVIAVEPQPEAAQHIPEEANVFVGAAGARSGSAELYRCAANSYMSTIMPDYRVQVQQHAAAFGGLQYDPPRSVPMLTLDDLIVFEGLPAFAKIDVEGAELEVLHGLSQPLPALSFEVHDFDRGKADACVDYLLALDPEYRFGHSRGESFMLEPWPPRDGRLSLFGDVYAWQL